MPSCNHTARPHSSGTPHTDIDILTYRYSGQLVYVPMSPSYNQALSHAREAFPQLKDLRDASLSLSLSAPTPGAHAKNCIGISAPAWPKLIAHMSRYQIVDVHVVRQVPNITITYADAEDTQTIEYESEPAPPYQGSDDRGLSSMEDEKAACSSSPPATTAPTRPRSPSSATLHPKRSWFFQKLAGQ